MSTKESSIHLIDSLTGEEKKKLYAKADGVRNLKFTHHESCVLFCSERNNFDIKYLCGYDNRYLRYYKGHSGEITSLSMSPLDDGFITSSNDKTICLWNLSSPSPIGKLQLPPKYENPIASYDESGVVFGVLCQDSTNKNHHLKLFDARNYDAGPFQEILPERSLIDKAIIKSGAEWSPAQMQKCIDGIWNSFEFSTDGNHILVNTQSDLLLVIDGFRADIEPLAITTRKNDTAQLTLGSCLTPNSKYVVTANEDNEVLIYDYKTVPGQIKSVLTGHVAPVGCVRCNPKYDVIASGCLNTVLWIPKVV